MAGTKTGGQLAAEQNLANDPDFYSKIGKKGGSAPHKSRPFQVNRELASRAGKRGGQISRRG